MTHSAKCRKMGRRHSSIPARSSAPTIAMDPSFVAGTLASDPVAECGVSTFDQSTGL